MNNYDFIVMLSADLSMTQSCSLSYFFSPLLFVLFVLFCLVTIVEFSVDQAEGQVFGIGNAISGGI